MATKKRKAKKSHCAVVVMNGVKRRICRTAKGKIKSNTKLSGLGKTTRKRRVKRRK